MKRGILTRRYADAGGARDSLALRAGQRPATLRVVRRAIRGAPTPAYRVATHGDARRPPNPPRSVTLFLGRALVTLCCLARLAPSQAPPCQTIERDRIVAQDLATLLPAFKAVPPEAFVASSPQPGSRRTIHACEILSFAQRYSIALDAAPDVCFEWAMERLDRTRVLEAMQTSLGIPEARIEIAETSLNPVPRGRLEFARERLGMPASQQQSAPVLWRGDVIYAGGHRYAVWARVRITASCQKVFAAESLKPGRAIEARQLRAGTMPCFPSAAGAAVTADALVGMAPNRYLAAGSEIRPDWVARPNEVNRGDLVAVEVHCGAARLSFTGRAESSGRSGDEINVRNPSSNRIFRARVTGRGRASVEADPTKGD